MTKPTHGGACLNAGRPENQLGETKMSKIDILNNSLINKENAFNNKFNIHFDTVSQANGQPLNDKRNGAATLAKWNKQDTALSNLKKSIESTKEAIDKEQSKIGYVEVVNNSIPIEILNLVKKGTLVQWRKHPTTFFVSGVDKARIVWDIKNNILAYRYLSAIKDKDQYRIFAKTFNSLKAMLNQDQDKASS